MCGFSHTAGLTLDDEFGSPAASGSECRLCLSIHQRASLLAAIMKSSIVMKPSAQNELREAVG